MAIDYKDARTLAELIQMIQDDRGLSERGLALEMGLGHTTLNVIKKGKETRDTEVLKAIARYAGLPIERVLALAVGAPLPPHWTPDIVELANLLQRLSPEDRDLLRAQIRAVIAARRQKEVG